MFKFTCWFWIIFAIILFMMMTVSAADTTEIFDMGATDIEFYVGYDGISSEKKQGIFSIETVTGFGVTDNISLLINLSGEFGEHFNKRSSGIGLGVFSTLFDSDHFDLDIYLNTGAGLEGFYLSPAMEINIDLKPDLELAGIYFRIEQLFVAILEPESSRESCVFVAETSITSGIYFKINDSHQLLFEYDMAVLNNPANDEERLNIGGIALGYNVTFHENIELISQLYYGIPQNDEKHSFGVSIGTIITM